MSKKQHRGLRRPRPCVIEWDDENWSHFEEHGRCTKTQVEDILASTCHDSLRELQRGETYIYHGITCAGRNLTVVAKVRRFSPDEAAEAERSGRVRGLGRAKVDAQRAAGSTKAPLPVVERVRPVTCWALSAANLASYYAWRNTNKVR